MVYICRVEFSHAEATPFPWSGSLLLGGPLRGPATFAAGQGRPTKAEGQTIAGVDAAFGGYAGLMIFQLAGLGLAAFSVACGWAC